MSTATKTSPESNSTRLEEVLNDIVLAFNQRRQSILRQFNVNEMEVEIISYLDENEMKKMKEVGEHFNIKLSTLTSTIDKLEKNKLVKRKNSKEDRRVIFIRPTKTGQKLLESLTDSTRELANRLSVSLSDADCQTLIGNLGRIVEFANS